MCLRCMKSLNQVTMILAINLAETELKLERALSEDSYGETLHE